LQRSGRVAAVPVRARPRRVASPPSTRCRQFPVRTAVERSTEHCMKTIENFPHTVRAIENVFIPMRDGARLAARIWMPEGAEQLPVPAILEYIPYRKRDNSRGRDELNHPYMAG